jgi:hypothetical protein
MKKLCVAVAFFGLLVCVAGTAVSQQAETSFSTIITEEGVMVKVTSQVWWDELTATMEAVLEAHPGQFVTAWYDQSQIIDRQEEGEFWPLTDPNLLGYRFRVEIYPDAGNEENFILGSREPDCIPETLCVSGALAGRSEIFTKIIGPRPSGFCWVQISRFSPSSFRIFILQEKTGRSGNIWFNKSGNDPHQNLLGGVEIRTFLEPLTPTSCFATE